jgi:hypothetical protein
MPGNALSLGKNDMPKMPRELAEDAKIVEQHKLMLKKMDEWAAFVRTVQQEAREAQGAIDSLRQAAARATRGADSTKAKACEELMAACDRSMRLFSSLI